MTSIGDAVISTDRARRIVFANPVAEALTGWTATEMQGELLDTVFRTVREAMTSSDECARRDDRVARLGGHTILVRRDGTEIAIDDGAAPIRDRDGAIMGTVLVFRDVRERALAERERQLRTSELELSVAVSAALATENVFDVQLQACAGAIVQHLGAAFARIWTLTGSVLKLRASAGLYTRLDDEHACVPLGVGTIGQIASDRHVHVTNEVRNDPDVSDLTWARREQMRSFAGFPIIIDGRLIGVLAMFSRAPVSSEMLTSLASVANQLAIGIERSNVTSERERLLI